MEMTLDTMPEQKPEPQHVMFTIIKVLPPPHVLSTPARGDKIIHNQEETAGPPLGGAA